MIRHDDIDEESIPKLSAEFTRTLRFVLDCETGPATKSAAAVTLLELYENALRAVLDERQQAVWDSWGDDL